MLRLASLLVGIAFVLAGNGLLGTLVALRLSDAGYAPLASGLILTAYFLGFMFGTLATGRTIAAVGQVRAFTAFATTVAAVALLHGLSSPSWLWALLRFLSGLGMAGLFMSVESWLNAAAGAHERGRVLGAYMVAVYLGLGVGQLFLNTWPTDAVELFSLVAILISVGVLPVALTRTWAPPLQPHKRLPLRMLTPQAPLGLVTALASGILSGTVYALTPIYGHMTGLSTGSISVLMSALIFGGLALQWPIGWLSDRTDRRRIMLGLGLAIVATSSVLASSQQTAPWMLYVPSVLLGGLIFALYPIGVAHTFDRLDRSLMLDASSQLLLASAVGSVLGPAVGSLAMRLAGADGLFLFDAGVGGVLATYAAWRIWSFDAVPVSEQQEFVVMPRTTAVVAELDPRADGDAA